MKIDQLASFLFLLVFFSASASTQMQAQKKPEKQPWQKRLAVSLNGEIPRPMPSGFETNHWHSFRLHPGCAEGSRLGSWGDGKQYPDLREIRKLQIFENERSEQLKFAIIEEDLVKMRQLIDGGVDVDSTGLVGLTALHIAFMLDTNPEPFELLLENGADPTKTLHFDRTKTLQIDGTKAISRFFRGKSVAHYTALTRYNRLFGEVFKNKKAFEAQTTGLTWFLPEDVAFQSFDGGERLKLFVAAGRDIDSMLNLANTTALILKVEDQPWRSRAINIIRTAIELKYDCSRWFGMQHPLVEPKYRCHCQLIHLFAKEAITHPDRFAANDEAQELLRILHQKGYSLENAKGDFHRWKKWHDLGFGELIELEHEMRLKDSTGAALKQWRETELKQKIRELLKSAA